MLSQSDKRRKISAAAAAAAAGAGAGGEAGDGGALDADAAAPAGLFGLGAAGPRASAAAGAAPPSPGPRARSGSFASQAGPGGGGGGGARGGSAPAAVFYDSIDYDVWARFMVYLRKMPPVLLHVDEETVGDAKFRLGTPVQLSVGAVVFLCDYDWLLAERARLRGKFRAAVRVIMVVINFMRPLTRADRQASRPRRASMVMRSIRNFADAVARDEEAGAARDEDTGAYVGPDGGRRFRYRRFIGVRSGSTRAGNVIGLLPARATVLLDEGTFLGEQLALEVTPLPPRAAGQDDAAAAAAAAACKCGGCCARRRRRSAAATAAFPAAHPSIGCTGAHVRRCVVVQGCEVRGLERMQVASVVWGRFLLRSVFRLLWGALYHLLACRWVRAAARRRPALLSEPVIERLLRVNGARRTACAAVAPVRFCTTSCGCVCVGVRLARGRACVR